MTLKDYIFLVYKQFVTRKFRTFLTMFAIGIGVGTMFILLSFVYGLQDLVTKRIAPMETLLTMDVTPGRLTKLDDESIINLKKIQGVEDVAPNWNMTGQANSKENNPFADITINASSSQNLTYDGQRLSKGRFFKDGQPECLVSSGSLKLFLDDENIIGKELDIRKLSLATGEKTETAVPELKQKVKVVGIIDDEDATIIYLEANQIKSIAPNLDYSGLKIKFDDAKNMTTIKEAVQNAGYDATAVYDMVEETARLFGYIRGAFALLGMIGLIVATIGMFNTLTISLLERTRDIGFMKAFGTTDVNVRSLFLTEATMIGLGGGFAGIVMGFLDIKIASMIIDYITNNADAQKLVIFITPVWVIFLTVIFSAILGFITGLYPARRASKISALEAIRYE
jgi:putative ABC transport system permease protein